MNEVLEKIKKFATIIGVISLIVGIICMIGIESILGEFENTTGYRPTAEELENTIDAAERMVKLWGGDFEDVANQVGISTGDLSWTRFCLAYGKPLIIVGMISLVIAFVLYLVVQEKKEVNEHFKSSSDKKPFPDYMKIKSPSVFTTDGRTYEGCYIGVNEWLSFDMREIGFSNSGSGMFRTNYYMPLTKENIVFKFCLTTAQKNELYGEQTSYNGMDSNVTEMIKRLSDEELISVCENEDEWEKEYVDLCKEELSTRRGLSISEIETNNSDSAELNSFEMQEIARILSSMSPEELAENKETAMKSLFRKDRTPKERAVSKYIIDFCMQKETR